MQPLTDLPTDRAVRVVGAEALTLAIEPLPDSAPAIVTYSFGSDRAALRPSEIVDEILRQFEGAAMELYPAWLPEAEGIESPGGAGAAAVRALALRLAAQSHHFGPFVADLALRSLGGEARRTASLGGGPRPASSGGRSSFSAEVRAAGLARVIAASFGRRHAAMLVVVPEGLPAAVQRALAAACEWLAANGHLGVWLEDARLTAADWLECVTPELPGEHRPAIAGPAARDLPALTYPAVAGRPHPASRAEQALEAALAARGWATGRCWNRTMSLHSLTNPVQPDLVWDDARCVVEIDGDDHLDRRKYALDRARDVDLQLAGYAVLRFTNDQVLADTGAVLAKLERFLAGRRLR